VVIDAETVPATDVTAVGMIVDLRDELTDRGIGLYIARDVGQVRDLLETAGGAMLIEHLCPSVDEAVTAARDQPTRPEED
jgi:sulfate permease, SulP family